MLLGLRFSYLARLTHPEVSHSTFLSRRKLLDQEREFSNQNVWLASTDSNHGLRRNVGSRDQAINQIKVAEVLLVCVGIRAAVWSDIQPRQKINAGAVSWA